MKKIVLLILTGIIIAIMTACGSKDYPKTMIVTEVNEESDTVILIDNEGFEWEIYGVEDWEIGDIGSCIMNDNGTEDITDDEIVDIRYGGYFPQM